MQSLVSAVLFACSTLLVALLPTAPSHAATVTVRVVDETGAPVFDPHSVSDATVVFLKNLQDGKAQSQPLRQVQGAIFTDVSAGSYLLRVNIETWTPGSKIRPLLDTFPGREAFRIIEVGESNLGIELKLGEFSPDQVVSVQTGDAMLPYRHFAWVADGFVDSPDVAALMIGLSSSRAPSGPVEGYLHYDLMLLDSAGLPAAVTGLVAQSRSGFQAVLDRLNRDLSKSGREIAAEALQLSGGTNEIGAFADPERLLDRLAAAFPVTPGCQDNPRYPDAYSECVDDQWLLHRATGPVRNMIDAGDIIAAHIEFLEFFGQSVGDEDARIGISIEVGDRYVPEIPLDVPVKIVVRVFASDVQPSILYGLIRQFSASRPAPDWPVPGVQGPVQEQGIAVSSERPASEFRLDHVFSSAARAANTGRLGFVAGDTVEIRFGRHSRQFRIAEEAEDPGAGTLESISLVHVGPADNAATERVYADYPVRVDLVFSDPPEHAINRVEVALLRQEGSQIRPIAISNLEAVATGDPRVFRTPDFIAKDLLPDAIVRNGDRLRASFTDASGQRHTSNSLFIEGDEAKLLYLAFVDDEGAEISELSVGGTTRLRAEFSSPPGSNQTFEAELSVVTGMDERHIARFNGQVFDQTWVEEMQQGVDPHVFYSGPISMLDRGSGSPGGGLQVASPRDLLGAAMSGLRDQLVMTIGDLEEGEGRLVVRAADPTGRAYDVPVFISRVDVTAVANREIDLAENDYLVSVLFDDTYHTTAEVAATETTEIVVPPVGGVRFIVSPGSSISRVRFENLGATSRGWTGTGPLNTARTAYLPAGNYVVRPEGLSEQAVGVPFAVSSGKIQTVDLRLPRLRVDLKSDLPEPRRVAYSGVVARVQVDDPTGRRTIEYRQTGTGPFDFEVLPGTLQGIYLIYPDGVTASTPLPAYGAPELGSGAQLAIGAQQSRSLEIPEAAPALDLGR